MSVDAAQFTQSATLGQTSPTQGSVAPPPVEQANVSVPGAATFVPDSQPAVQQGQEVAQGGEQPSQPEVDYRAELERERQLRQQREQENQQFRQGIQQFQQSLAQQQQQQQEQQELQMMLAQAEGMSTAEASQFLRNQIALRDQRKAQMHQQQLQQVQQQSEYMLRNGLAPAYAADLMKHHSIPEEAREELLSLGDPDLMFQHALAIKRRWDAVAAYKAQAERNNQQLARSQEVTALAQNGLTQVGGQNGAGAYQVEIPDDLDPDEKAMMLYAMQQRIERGLPPR